MRTVLAVATVLALSTAACSSSGSGSLTGSGGAAHAPSANRSASPSAPAASSPAAASSHPSSAAAAATGTRDVCSLLSAAEASKLNHVPYRTGIGRHITPGFDTCTYKNAGGAADPIDIQELSVKVITIANCWPEELSSVQSGGGKTATVSGVGDQAIGYEIGLLVRAGTTCVDIEGLTHAEFQGNYAPDIAMAKLIVGRL